MLKDISDTHYSKYTSRQKILHIKEKITFEKVLIFLKNQDGAQKGGMRANLKFVLQSERYRSILSIMHFFVVFLCQRLRLDKFLLFPLSEP